MLTFLLLLGIVHALVATAASRQPVTEAPWGTGWLVELARLRAERYRRLRRPDEDDD